MSLYQITGRVQGVGFRAYVASVAEDLNVDGAVWNTRAGGVEAVVVHESAPVLEEFEARLWKGPGRVEAVSRTDGSLYQVGPGFEIWSTR